MTVFRGTPLQMNLNDNAELIMSSPSLNRQFYLDIYIFKLRKAKQRENVVRVSGEYNLSLGSDVQQLHVLAIIIKTLPPVCDIQQANQMQGVHKLNLRMLVFQILIFKMSNLTHGTGLTLNTKGHLPPVSANRALLISSNSKQACRN